MKFSAFAFAALLALPVPATGADLAGGWKGTWVKDGDALPVTLAFGKSAAGYSGSFDSDALQVAAIPFAKVSDIDGKVHWLLKGDESTAVFDGELDGDALAGTFVDGATHGTFALARADVPAAATASRDVTFADGAVTLAGTLLLPAGHDPHPAAVFLQGSGPEGRWANGYLARKFAESGIAALIYDKRGVGASTGDWHKAGFEALADDAVAGVQFLRTQSGVDPARIGIYGHSQGGTIAPLVAARDGRLTFVVASAAAGLPPADVERFSVENAIALGALPPAEQKDADAYVRALIDVGYRGKSRTRLDALAAKFRKRTWYFAAPPPKDSYWSIARQIAPFDPMHWWSRVKLPVLLVYGAHDARVPPIRSANSIRAALASSDNLNVTLKVYPGADHTFTIVDPAKKSGWPVHEPDYAAVVTGWVKEKSGKRSLANGSRP